MGWNKIPFGQMVAGWYFGLLNPSIDKEISKYNLQLIIDAIHDGLVGHLGINKDYRP